MQEWTRGDPAKGPTQAPLARGGKLNADTLIGAYRAGADPQIDRAIALHDGLEGFLRQDKNDVTSLEAGFSRLDEILSSAPLAGAYAA